MISKSVFLLAVLIIGVSSSGYDFLGKTNSLSQEQIAQIEKGKAYLATVNLNNQQQQQYWREFAQKTNIDYGLLLEYLLSNSERKNDQSKNDEKLNTNLNQDEIKLIEEAQKFLSTQNYKQNEIQKYWIEFSLKHDINQRNLFHYLNQQEKRNHEQEMKKRNSTQLTKEQILLIEQSIQKLATLNYTKKQAVQYWIEFAKTHNINKYYLFDYLKSISKL